MPRGPDRLQDDRVGGKTHSVAKFGSQLFYAVESRWNNVHRIWHLFIKLFHRLELRYPSALSLFCGPMDSITLSGRVKLEEFNI